METSEPKAELRARIRTARKAIPDGPRHAGERAVARRLLELPAVARANAFGVYHAAGFELDLAPAIRALRALVQRPIIAYPLVTSKESMIFARFEDGENLSVLANPKELHDPTALDPARVLAPEDLDVLLVPGVAFDGHGRRLGQGGGYYDRYLPRLREDAIAIGIAFDEQIVDEVPHDPHDRRVGYIVTPSRLITVI